MVHKIWKQSFPAERPNDPLHLLYSVYDYEI